MGRRRKPVPPLSGQSLSCLDLCDPWYQTPSVSLGTVLSFSPLRMLFLAGVQSRPVCSHPGHEYDFQSAADYDTTTVTPLEKDKDRNHLRNKIIFRTKHRGWKLMSFEVTDFIGITV